MEPTSRRRSAPRLVFTLLLSTAALSTLACAGAGKSYACDADAGGTCHGDPFSDGGTTVADFVSPAITVWHDGMHNSDADVVSFQSALYTAFRHAPSFEASAGTSVVVLRSLDQGATWNKTAELNLSGLDLREPKLSVFGGELRVTATAWDPSDPSEHHTTVVAAGSSDGSAFSMLSDAGLNQGVEAWRPRQAGNSLWMTAWKADELYPADLPGLLSLFSSADGQNFSVDLAVPAGPGGHQGELIIRADSTLWLTIPERSETNSADKQTICHAPFAQPLDFTCWSAAQAPIGSPVLWEFSGVLFVSGEHDLPDGTARTAIWQVDEAQQSFDLIADLPQSEGETGSPGVLGLDPAHALLTYHSTSTLDPKVAALGHEPTTLEALSNNYQVDVLAVTIDLSMIPAGD